MKQKLSDIYELQMGKTPARKEPTYWNGSNMWVSISDLSSNGKFIKTTKEGITNEGVKASGIRSVPKGTLMMSFKLSLGKVAISDCNLYTNEAIMSFIDKGKYAVDRDYMYYQLQAIDWSRYTNKAVKGATLNKTTLSDVFVKIPSLDEQKYVVEKLDKTDRLIANLNKQNELIAESVKSRFVEMFGDLRINPCGWKIQSFADLTDLITDGEHATPRRVQKGIYLLSARNVLNHSIQLDDVDYIDEEEYKRIAKRVVPKEGDVLISCSGSVGRCCSVPAGLKFQMVRSAALLRFKSFINPVFAEYMITSDYLQGQINSAKTASSQANLFQGRIAKLKGFAPPIDLQKKFADFVAQADKSKLAVQQSIETLQTLKAKLMQDYFG